MSKSKDKRKKLKFSPAAKAALEKEEKSSKSKKLNTEHGVSSNARALLKGATALGAFAGGMAAANALVDNKAFGMTSQVDAAVGAT
ncbi:MAG: hypothetical protein PUF89_01445, partial [Lactobacillus porci]|nr:hypothetical protein [Lactobacillus porci]